jgi:hypothetical protein
MTVQENMFLSDILSNTGRVESKPEHDQNQPREKQRVMVVLRTSVTGMDDSNLDSSVGDMV